MSRASEAYGRLTAAMQNSEPGCQGIELFTSDDLTPTDKAVLKAICDDCPLFTLCADYATLDRPKGGYWAGKTYRSYNTKEGAAS